MSDVRVANNLSQQALMDAEAAGFAAATGKTNSRARESYIRNWGSKEIMDSYSKGFAEGFAINRILRDAGEPQER